MPKKKGSIQPDLPLYKGPQMAMFIDWDNIRIHVHNMGLRLKVLKCVEYLCGSAFKGTGPRYLYKALTSNRSLEDGLTSSTLKVMTQITLREKEITAGYHKKLGRVVRSANMDVDLTIDVM